MFLLLPGERLERGIASKASRLFFSTLFVALAWMAVGAQPTLAHAGGSVDCGSVDIPIEYLEGNIPDILIVGEWHGTVEGPQAVGDLACQLAAAGNRVAVLLEMPSIYSEQIATLGAPESGQRDLCQRLSSFWSIPADGRRSIAIASLILRVADLQPHFGDQISVGSISVSPGMRRPEGIGMATWIHSHMAQNIVRHSQEYDVIIINIGNAHPPSLRRSILSLPAAEHLDVVNVIQIREAGTAWNCQNGRCEVHPSEASWRHPPDPSIQEFPVLRMVEDVEGYDAALFIGPITASPPVAGSAFCSGVDTPHLRLE